METLIRAVTEDHAVALVTFQGTTPIHTKANFEALLLPIRHNGATNTSMLGAITAIEATIWFGVQPIMEQRITGLRLIWPDEAAAGGFAADIAASIADDVAAMAGSSSAPLPMAATIFGRTARRYAHLAVIDGGLRH